MTISTIAPPEAMNSTNADVPETMTSEPQPAMSGATFTEDAADQTSNETAFTMLIRTTSDAAPLSPNQEVVPAEAESSFAPASKPPAQLVRIIHYPIPDLTYTIHIRDIPLVGPPKCIPWANHTASEELGLFNFATSVFASKNFGPFTHFIRAQTLANLAAIIRVEWEAFDLWDVAGGSTLTVAKTLMNLLPRMKHIVTRLVLNKKDGAQDIGQNNLVEWKEGLETMRDGLDVTLRKTQTARFKTCMEDGSFRKVNPAEESGAAERSRQKKIARRRH
jgi:hypothetical protein